MSRNPVFPALMFIFFAISCGRPSPETDSIVTGNPLDRLMLGNKRFMSGHPVHPDETLDRIRKLKKGQNPFVVIVSCSDSRVPPELVFDQGIGDVFSIRTAGNVIGDYELGSIEYAVEHLGCKLVVVMGHENCGALDAYIHRGKERHHNHIQNLIDYIDAEVEEKQLPDSLKSSLEFTVLANIRHGVNLLRSSDPIIGKMYLEKKIKIIGAIYDLDKGEVKLIDQ
ncbi:MAG TPA: carbonic anhydrase [Chitinophagaceae bacterium]|nr:carbonic anhydrase [Chitinophagaceae bacterium]